MKPTYTVRLTGDLDADDRQRIAARVAGVTDIEADKIERLLERGTGRDLIKPSSANVANRLASVLAEAGAPIQLVPITGPESVSPDAAEGDRRTQAPADEDILRPRQSGAGRDEPVDAQPEPADASRDASSADVVEPVDPIAEPDLEPGVEAAAGPGSEPGAEHVVRPYREPTVDPASDTDVEDVEEHRGAATDRPRAAEDIPPPAPAADAALPEPEGDVPLDAETGTRADAAPEAAPKDTPAPPPEPEVTVTPPADAGVQAHPADRQRDPPPPPRTVEPPARPARTNGGSALLGAVGAAVLGIGAVFAIDLLVSPIAIGVLVLAVLALALSLLGQRRAMWLPGVGALALVVWALANAADGPMATLAANWQWYAMFAGSLLVVVAGFQEAQRGRGR